jgi:hypothetical protein
LSATAATAKPSSVRGTSGGEVHSGGGRAVTRRRRTLRPPSLDVNKAGKVVGYDLLYFVFNPKTESAKINFTAVINGGFVYGVANASANPVTHGTVTGGTGIFKGAAGTILAKNLNNAGTRTAITITYHS